MMIHGDCIEKMKELEPNSVDAIVTDPPYGLEFMGKEWDKLANDWGDDDAVFHQRPKGGAGPFENRKTPRYHAGPKMQLWHLEWAAEALRVLKPGGFLLAFGGTRTCHRLTCAIEDAGFEIRDMIAWVYGSGFPKSLNIGVAINKLETKEWSAIGKALDNISTNGYIDVWKSNLNGVKFVTALSQNQGTIVGRFIISKDFVQVDAAVKVSPKNSSSNANIVGNYSIAPQAIKTKEGTVQQNVEQIIIEINELQNPVKFAEKLQQKDLAMLWDIFTAGCDVKELLKEKTVETIKVEEALMTLRGNQKYSNEEIINVLCAVLTENLKHIILNLSKTFQNLDTKSQMECVSAINVTITEYIAECLITNTVNIAKQIAVDKLQGNERESQGMAKGAGAGMSDKLVAINKGLRPEYEATKGTSEYEGWGTALKPALEPITVARKPLSEKTVAQNVLKWGTGGININSCRIETNEIKTETHLHKSENVNVYGKSTERLRHNGNGTTHIGGRFPANLIHDGSDEVEAGFPDTKGDSKNRNPRQNNGKQDDTRYGKYGAIDTAGFTDSGSASRFFYCAKASKKDRDEGLNGFEVKQTTGGGGMNDPQGDDVCGKYGSVKAPSKNNHPTVKPTKLMQYLVRLVCPKGGVILDPFAGSGSTGKACKLEGFNFIGIEKEKEYFDIAEARIKHVEPELKLEI